MGLRPGALVVKRGRWLHDAIVVGLVVGGDDVSTLVMWASFDREASISSHLNSCLLDVSSASKLQVRVSTCP